MVIYSIDVKRVINRPLNNLTIQQSTNHLPIQQMTVSHRAHVRQMKVARMACCCKLSELLPLVRQLHEQSRAAYLASQGGSQSRPEAA